MAIDGSFRVVVISLDAFYKCKREVTQRLTLKRSM